MRAAVTDLGRWQASLEHWLSHAWNPRNLPGLLELYARGGPAACRYCLKSRPNSQAKALTPLDQNFSAIDDLRKELNRE